MADTDSSRTTPYKRDFSGRERLLMLSLFALVIGAISTFTAYVLLGLIHFFTNLFFYQTLSFAASTPAGNELGGWVILIPAIGGLIVGLMARYGSEGIRGHGIPEALEAILFGKSRMSPKVAALKPLSSGIAIGSGGPFGAEGPIIMTGGAAASLLAQAFHLTSYERKALLVAGACAGMTAVFGTPLAAVLLAVELLLFELRPRSLVPVALACAVAGFLRTLWAEPAPLFPLHTAELGAVAMLAGAVAGLLSGALSAAMTHCVYQVEDAFERLRLHWMWWPVLGGLVVGLGGLIEPRALGVGYDVIRELLNAHLVITSVVVLVVVKAVIWAVALGSGTSGGVLAPLLIIGAGLGAVIGPWMPGGGDPRLWAMVCMAATLAGTMRAPLMATVFAFELTHDANAFLPVLLGSVVAYGFSVAVMSRSILTEKIARHGQHVYREYGIDPLERSFVREVMTPDPVTIPGGMRISEVVATYFGSAQAQRAYPVVSEGQLIGIVDRRWMQSLEDGDDRAIAALMPDEPPVHASPTDTCRAVASRMTAFGLERLPVVSSAETRQLVGIVSRSDLLKPTRRLYEEEWTRDGFFRRTRTASAAGQLASSTPKKT